MRDIFEAIIVFAVMTVVLLPVRLLFVAYVSDNWFGSFGIISAVSVAMIILTKKDKLGPFGRMFSRQMYKFQKGKRAIAVYGEATFLIVIFGVSIFAIEQGNSVNLELKEQMFSENQEFTSAQKIIQETSKWEAGDWFAGIVSAPVGLVTAFPQMSSAMAVINDSFDGWPLHFYTVGFVEYLEFFGILLVYRFYFKAKETVLVPESIKPN